MKLNDKNDLNELIQYGYLRGLTCPTSVTGFMSVEKENIHDAHHERYHIVDLNIILDDAFER